MFGAALERHTPLCGYLTPEQLAYVFGPAGSGIGSSVLLPLWDELHDRCVGLLAVGSADPRRFHAEMGTAFVAHLGAVVARVLCNHLRAESGV